MATRIKQTMQIEIDIHCYYYQIRLCWMLSSILQQQGDKPDIVINISHAENDGTPTTAEVCRFFASKGLNIRETIVSQEEVPNRAIARNMQVNRACREKDVDWLLFSDSDMVYDPMFFCDLAEKIRDRENSINVFGADRTSLKRPYCMDYFANKDLNCYPCVIKNVAYSVSSWKVFYVGGGDKAAGYFQLASLQMLTGICNGKYSKENKDNFSKCITDRKFRNMFEGIEKIDVLPQYHINHDRERWHRNQSIEEDREQR